MAYEIDSPTYKHDLPAPWNILLPLSARLLVWGLLFYVIYLLSSFFLLIFLTFTFAYMQNFFVENLKSKIPKRLVRVLIGGALLLTLVISVITYLFPQVKRQAEFFASKHSQYLHTLDSQIAKYRNRYEIVGYILPQVEKLDSTFDERGLLSNWDLHDSVSASMLQQLIGIARQGEVIDAREAVHGIKGLIGGILTTGSYFLLSLLFSFLIVLDLPRLTNSVRDLRNTKIRFIYLEVADTIKNFSSVVGSAIFAQLLIALLNTGLTAIGVNLLGLGQQTAFLSIIVFLCSFIPVAGVFISSAPICLLALEYGGVQLVLLAIVMIWIIHIIEAYILNPHIYGSKLRINPVLVLIILTLGGKLFGVWGLALGLPVCTYIFGYAIREPLASND